MGPFGSWTKPEVSMRQGSKSVNIGAKYSELLTRYPKGDTWPSQITTFTSSKAEVIGAFLAKPILEAT